ncbi:protein Churchill-like [Actinia tenebrosa]|uniref:Protein Churchill n=1 Tax=Actinia tenebrosa TaxID=6105 RepID=A0A6P8H3T4_ACTTE|nr:protein Churchill-like [Actinia tenebrosa]
MCRDCVKEELPDRGRMCVENGSYLWNYECCKECGKKEPIEITNRTEEDDNDEELVTYKHVCTICGHVIAEHTYTFSVDEEYQAYTMTCLLCGRGSDLIRINIETSMPNGVC